MSDQLTPKDRELAVETKLGRYDTDEGGRKPERRDQMRNQWFGIAELADSSREDWDLLPLHDLVMIQRLAGLVSARASELVIVRLQQSQNETAFRRPRPKGRPIADNPQA